MDRQGCVRSLFFCNLLSLLLPTLIPAAAPAADPADLPGGLGNQPVTDPVKHLPGTRPLTQIADMAVENVAGVDRFLDKALERSIEGRARHWHRDLSSPAAYAASIEPNRQQLAAIVGATDPRVKPTGFEFLSAEATPAPVGMADRYKVWAVRWPVFAEVTGEGLILEPNEGGSVANVVMIPDCSQTPEMIAGLTDGATTQSQLARRLAENGCRVIVPTLVDRQRQFSVIAHGQRKADVTHRELVNRPAYEMGRTLIGLEIQRILGAIDALPVQRDTRERPLAVIGYGEGGLLALYAGALDTRIKLVGVSGYFDSRQDVWREPIDRNLFGLLDQFGDAEIASLVAPRRLVVEACGISKVDLLPGTATAPGRLVTPKIESVRKEFERLQGMLADLKLSSQPELIVSGDGAGPPACPQFAKALLTLAPGEIAAAGPLPKKMSSPITPEARLQRQIDELARYCERLVDEGQQVRDEFLSKLNINGTLAEYHESTEPYRQFFAEKVIGQFADPLVEPNVRTRLRYSTPDYFGYEVVIDVWPEVILYGILLIPTDIAPGQRRPVVVCQHGHEGRPEFTIEGNRQSYENFSSRLAQRGFIVFAPQHLYRGGDSFRTLQRKANPLGKSLFSVMVAQHRQLLAWLGSLEYVDPRRIAFYGISYGGKSAMRIPAILDGYCLSICSSDFSDWIWRTVSNRHSLGYLAHVEYEIFEFNLGSTFNYAEMAALIAPRPFMVEDIGHKGDVWSKRAATQIGQVELLYEALGIRDRFGLSYFPGKPTPEQVQNRPPFDFLHKHLEFAGRR